MDAAAWQTCTKPESMLRWLQESGQLTERKTRLFGCACMRRVWHLLADEAAHGLLLMVESYAEDKLSLEELERAGEAMLAPHMQGLHNSLAGEALLPLVLKAFMCAGLAQDGGQGIVVTAARIVATSTNSPSAANQAMVLERAAQATLLRDMFVPFRKKTLAPSVLAWHDGTVVNMARTMYEERDFSVERMAGLAEALKEAGCTDEEVLAHCRAGNGHFLGCWVFDLILGKS